MKNSTSKNTATESWYTLYDVATNICTHCEFFTHGLQPSNSTLKLVTNEIKPIYNSIDDTIIEGATSTEVTQASYLKFLDSESKRYLKRTKDGQEAYAKISAEFRIAKLNGIITELAHGIIESELIGVRNEILAGQWISGRQKLESLGNIIIGVSLYNRLHLQITTYIVANY